MCLFIVWINYLNTLNQVSLSLQSNLNFVKGSVRYFSVFAVPELSLDLRLVHPAQVGRALPHKQTKFYLS